jgi:drug/metabolite transporter (DMT)-like permease
MTSPSAAPSARPSLWIVVACLASVYVVWGTTYFALKVGVREVAPYFLLGTRFAVAGGLMLAFLFFRGGPLPSFKQWANSALLGLLLLVISLGNVTTAEQWVTSGAAVALIATMPLMMAIWSGLFGRWPRRAEWATILLGLAGTLVMILGQDFRVSPLGTGLILMACASWSFGSVLGNHIDVPRGAMGFAAEMLAGGVLCLIVSLFKGEPWTPPHTPAVWGAWAYLVIAGSLIAFSAYRYLVEAVSPTLAATYAYVNPPVALFVGWWLGGESFSKNVFIGLPIVLASVGLLAFVQFRAPPEPAR